MSTRVFLALAAALLLIRLPSLVQPMGADQSLYAYVGEQIRAGGLPYRDAWDQKPPAIHFLYAGLRTVYAGDGVVPFADLAAAAGAAWLLYLVGRELGPPGTASWAALIFLLLSNPAFTRLAGVRLRSQCETFIAVIELGALLLLARSRGQRSGGWLAAAGVLFGLAFTFKYNTAVFALAGLATLWIWKKLWPRAVYVVGAGAAVPVLAFLLVFAAGGALPALFDATILYNLEYSRETYRGTFDALRYLVTFPIDTARVDGLWTLGGAGCLVLLMAARAQRDRLIPVIWVAAACASIAINGSRSLPQYFIQANPFLALAAGWGGVAAWRWMRDRLGRRAVLLAVPAMLLVAIGVWRVNQFPKLADQTLFDAQRALGRIPDAEYLARYDDDRKYSARSGRMLGEYFEAHSAPADRVFVFGFTCSAYVYGNRMSASRFFWSRPVIAGFKAGSPGYGVEGMLSEIAANRPAVIALQERDWAPDVEDSRPFFMAAPALAGHLRANYVQAPAVEGFDVWLRRSDRP
jgi:4-amino-4-deoxy-L-arabinose transferase-like glycosyltransferase